MAEERGIRLEFAQFGHFDSFEVFRSLTPMDALSLPEPHATGLKTMRFMDNINLKNVLDRDLYYRVRVIRGTESMLSAELKTYISTFNAPQNLIVAFANNALEMEWDFENVTELHYYCSESPIDINNLPLPKAVIAGNVRTYVDTDIEIGKTYYVAVGSVKNGVEKLGLVKTVIARDINNIVSLMPFDTDFTDLTGKIWTPQGGVSISGGAAVFVTNGALESQNSIDFAYGTGDFEWNVELELNSIAGNLYIIDHGAGNAGTLSYYLNQLRYYNPVVGVFPNLYNTGISLAVGTKYTIEVKRVLGITSIYIDDVLRVSGSDTYNYTAQKVWIGRYPAGNSQFLNGKIDYFRIKKIP